MTKRLFLQIFTIFFKFFIVATEKIALNSTLKLNSLIYGKERKKFASRGHACNLLKRFFLYILKAVAVRSDVA